MKIDNAYDAFWFLYEHPKLCCREARLISSAEAKKLKLGKGERIRKVRDTMPWAKNKTYLLHEFALRRESLPENLSIWWTKVDERRRVNKDKTKNQFIECWLEFGTIKYEVADGHCGLQHYHDMDLDCGASTFDQALVKLARLVKKHYGDFSPPKWLRS